MNYFLFALSFMISYLLVVCWRAYWYFFQQATEHRRNLEMMIVELVRRLPLEDVYREDGKPSIQVWLYNCQFRLKGRNYDQSNPYKHLRFWKWLSIGVRQSILNPRFDYGRDGLFLDDGMYRKSGTYFDFLRSLGYEVTEDVIIESLPSTVVIDPSKVSFKESNEDE